VEYIHYSRCLAGVVFNPGAYTHYSWALHDAIAATPTPVIEIHIANIHTREEWRQHSCVAAVCKGTIVGAGVFVSCLVGHAVEDRRALTWMPLLRSYSRVPGVRTRPAVGGQARSGSAWNCRVIPCT
jgi:hypothetical protein